MLPERRRSRQVSRIVNVAAALAVSAALLALLEAGFGIVPGLGPALDPGHGAWASAHGGVLPGSRRLRLAGLREPVSVSYSATGVPSIRAESDTDLFLALGYVHARFRLAQMDLERRAGEGRLAQLAGPAAVRSDRLELRLGLLRTARQEWADMPRSSLAARALIAYSRGVNDDLAQLRRSGQWPALFSLTGVYPARWTPVDSLVIQGDFTQGLSFTTTPLDYALLERSLGPRRTMAWFGVQQASPQHAWDPGPYHRQGLAPLVTTGWLGTASPGQEKHEPKKHGRRRTTAAVRRPTASRVPVRRAGRGKPATVAETDLTAQSVAAVLKELRADQIPEHEYPDSNAWAANGRKVANGGALLAGDPHLPQTLPSFWYEVALSAPGLSVSGVSTPGLPGVLIGHNASISWSLTDTQNQSVFFYDEKTSRSRPDQYYWRGRWRRMRQIQAAIPVRGGATRHVTVLETVHGPVLTQAGQTVSVDWMGAVPSPDLAVLLRIDTARNFTQFSAALASWRAPAENFVYADRRGNIGAIAAGYYPQVRHGQPWLPLSGTGADDVAGVIPYSAIPRVYDPRSKVIASANQRPVTASYPYYLGTSANAFDPGYRADTEYAYLRGHARMTAADFARLQQDQTDGLSRDVVPRLLAALRTAKLTPEQQQAEQVLADWDGRMTTSSAGASIWWTFWGDYLDQVFRPWWRSRHVPVHLDRPGLSISPYQFSLDQVLQQWTEHDPRNPVFGPAGRPKGTARSVMRTAFAAAVAELAKQLGGSPPGWRWGRLHARKLRSLTGASALGYGPRAAGGDPFTVDAAYGRLLSEAGPTWRMIVHFAAGSRGGPALAEGTYPGGQSENPASPWYDNLTAGWWAGRLPAMPSAGLASGKASRTGSAAGKTTDVGAGRHAGRLSQGGPSSRATWELVP